MKVLVTAASRYGATAEIATAIVDVLAAHGHEVTALPPDQAASVDGYDAVVLGSAVYAGHWLPAARDFAQRSGEALATRPLWLFSSGPVGDPARKLVQKMGVPPLEVGEIRERTHALDHRMFAGRLDAANLPVLQRAALAAFSGLQGDFRDWDAIRAWASGISDVLESLSMRRAVGEEVPIALR